MTVAQPAAAIERRLQVALAALVRDGRVGVARWAARALPRLPEVVRQLGVTTVKSSPDLTMVVHLRSPNERYDMLYLRNYAVLNVKDRLARLPGLRMIEPAGYLDFLKLMSSARLVLTDSGGIQEETTILQVPCLTLRENTERPVTVEIGTNQLVGRDPERILAAYRKVLEGGGAAGRLPPGWDGRAAGRIATILERVL